MKRTITILLAMLLCLNLAVTAFGADTCIVAGCAALCGSEWQPDDQNNAMTLFGSTTYRYRLPLQTGIEHHLHRCIK